CQTGELPVSNCQPPRTSWQLAVGSWEFLLLERQTETELHRPRRVRQVRRLLRLEERAARLDQIVSSVVLPVEQVEHFQAARKVRPACQRNTLQEPQLHPVNRIPDEAVTRNDAANRSARIRGATQT